MSPRRLASLMLVLAALLCLASAAPAQAAKRKVPFGFFGSVFSPLMLDPRAVSDPALDQQLALMAGSGVETIRVTVSWDYVEPAPGAYRFSNVDRVVAAAARHGVAVLLNVTATPKWASSDPNSVDYWRLRPSDPNVFAELMRQLVLRYGPAGSLWAQDPSLPRTPVRRWQVWNEQTANWYWRPPPWAPAYTQLLRASYQAIHSADPGAKVVAGSLIADKDYAPWDSIRDLYRAGAKRFFDVVSVHPFTNHGSSVSETVKQVVKIIRRVRASMRRSGDARKPIIVTELTWPASVGRVPEDALLGLETTTRGQIQRLKAAYRTLVKLRRKLRVTEVYWYTWATEYDTLGSRSVMTFRYSGLTRFSGGVFSPMPLLGTYSRLAAKYEGCRKTGHARYCR
jgi:Beta-galactosidase